MRSRTFRIAMLVSSFSMSYCVYHVPPGNPSAAEWIEVGSCSAVRAHLRNHPGDQPGEDAMTECNIAGAPE